MRTKRDAASGRMIQGCFAGYKFHKFTCVRRSDRRSADGLLQWWCRCECGREVEVTTKRIPTAYQIAKNHRVGRRACDECLARVCVVCGVRFFRKQMSTTVACSKECMRQHELTHAREYERKKREADPKYGQMVHARRKAKLASDPELAARERANRRRNEKKKAQIARARRAWLKLHDPEAYAALREKENRYRQARFARVALESISKAQREMEALDDDGEAATGRPRGRAGADE